MNPRIIPILLTALSVVSLTGASEQALFQSLRFRYIGPPGNKVVSVAGVPGNPDVVYAGTPSGGVFKSVNGGALWQPIFDRTGIASIGHIAVAPSNPNVVWVGTGDPFVRENVSIGDGVYRSTDAGATWTHVGLDATGRIGRVAVHPTNPDTAFVAAVGRGYAPSTDRGLFRTRDAGRTWERVLFVDENTGAVDVVFEPGNPQVIYTATWTIAMGPGGNEAGGSGSGIYRSRDGGTTWSKLTNGLPSGPLGRIGFAVSPAQPKWVYALISTPQPENGVLWRTEDGGETWSVRSRDARLNARAIYFSQFAAFPDNANELIVLAQHGYSTKDGGQTIKVEYQFVPDGHAIWIDARDPRRALVANDRFVFTTRNRGLAWSSVDLPNGQIYGVSTDNKLPYNVYGIRHDGPGFRGPSNSLRLSATRLGRPENRLMIGNDDWEYVPTSAEVGVMIPDHFDDDYVWIMTPWSFTFHDYRAQKEGSVAPWTPAGPGAWASAADRVSGFALAVSRHVPQEAYAASQYVYQTLNRGQTWVRISPDLTGGTLPVPSGPWTDGRVLSAIYSLAESPLERGVLWAGSTDGMVHVTRDDGRTWTNVTAGLQGVGANGVVTCIEPSRYVRGTAYLTIDRHKMDDRSPYVFKTADYGATWQAIVTGIPRSAVSYARAIREDTHRQGLLYLGTEGGLFFSYDAGGKWNWFPSNLPRVPISGIAVQETFNDLVISTFGRGFWVLDDIAAVQEYTPAMTAAASHLFTPRPGFLLGSGSNRTADLLMRIGVETPSNAGENPPSGVPITYHLRTASAGPVTVSIADAKGDIVRTLEAQNAAGINRVWWGLDRDTPQSTAAKDRTGAEEGNTRARRVEPGVYTVRLSVDGQVQEARVTVTQAP